MLIYRNHKKTIVAALAASVVIHGLTIFGTYLFGISLMINTDGYTYLGMLGLIPAVFILSSFSITPAGLGVGESLSIFFLASLGAGAEQAIAIMLLFRVGGIFWGLLGGVFVFSSPLKKDFKDIEAEMA